jgi:hypothetical protein
MTTRPLRPLAEVPADRTAGPPRKPNATARRVSLFEREIRIKLSSAAIEILLDAAEVLSEGQPQGDRWFGSTMITVDLSRLADAVREECDAASALRVAELVAADPRIRARARTIAAAEAEAQAGGRLARVAVDLRARAVGALVHIDLDVEGDLARMAR